VRSWYVATQLAPGWPGFSHSGGFAKPTNSLIGKQPQQRLGGAVVVCVSDG
jgi:hypothetical protein